MTWLGQLFYHRIGQTISFRVYFIKTANVDFYCQSSSDFVWL